MELIEGQSWEFNSIKMGYGLSKFEEGEIFTSINNKDCVRMHFGIKGDYSFKHKELNKSFNLIGGHHNIMYSDGMDLEIRNKSNEIETFGIEFPKDLFIEFTKDGSDGLKSFCNDIKAKKSSIISDQWGAITIDIQRIISELRFNPYAGNTQRLFLLAKSIELLVLCCENYSQKSSFNSNYIKSTKDKKKLMLARDIIISRYNNPPNLSELSKEIGLNEFKLKKGFKEMFGSTIFAYMTKFRLDKAKKELLDSSKTIGEIAYEMGYSSPQHFSQQFKHRFGITPKSIRINP